MRITQEKLTELTRIMLRDYGVVLTDAEAEQLGISMLRVYRLATTALARSEGQEALATNGNAYVKDKI